MKTSKQLQIMMSLVLALSILLSACTTEASPTPEVPTIQTKATQPPAVEESSPTPVLVEGELTSVSFWHSLGGESEGAAVTQMVNDFNASQGWCQVTASHQGSYDESLGKLKAGLASGDTPGLIQLNDITTRRMLELDAVVPVQAYFDKEGFAVSDLEENMLAAYAVNGMHYAMPFTISTPVIFYNKDMFRAAGLDADNPPRTFAEFSDTARRLTASGVYGAAFAINGWNFEQLLAVSGGTFTDNENGRSSRASMATFNSAEGVALMDWWKSMYDAGSMANYGRNAAETHNAFLAGQTAMILDSTASLRGLVDSAAGTFEVGTAFLPRPNEEAFSSGGIVTGGSALWMIKDRPQPEQDCAWEFIKFMTSAEQQAYWTTISGSLPLRKSASEHPLLADWRSAYPQFQTAIDQLHASPTNAVTQGALIGVFPAVWQSIDGAIELILAGASTSQEALDRAAGQSTTFIQEYNASLEGEQ